MFPTTIQIFILWKIGLGSIVSGFINFIVLFVNFFETIMCPGSGTASSEIVSGDQIIVAKEGDYNEERIRARRTESRFVQEIFRKLPVNGLRGLPLNEASLSLLLLLHIYSPFFTCLNSISLCLFWKQVMNIRSVIFLPNKRFRQTYTSNILFFSLTPYDT